MRNLWKSVQRVLALSLAVVFLFTSMDYGLLAVAYAEELAVTAELPAEQEIEPAAEEPVAEPIAEPVAEPEAAPAAEQEAAPVEEPVVEPETEEPVVEPETEKPVVEPETEEPVVEPETEEPVVEPETEEPVVEPETEEPVVEPETEEPVVEPETEEPVVEPEDEPVVEPEDEPVVEPEDEPVVEPEDEPVVDPEDEPVVDPEDEPVIEPEDEPVVEEPTVEPTVTPEPTEGLEPTETLEPVEELELGLTTGNRYVFAGEESISLHAQISGGVAPFTVKLIVENSGETVFDSVLETTDNTSAAFTYAPTAWGQHTLTMLVTDAAGTTAKAAVSVPVAIRETVHQGVWEETVSGVKLTGDWRVDLVAIARTQLGYEESEKNFIIDEDGVRHGYTRYGEWYGAPYSDWCGMFLAFCANYAEISSGAFPRDAHVGSWASSISGALERDTLAYVPQAGDLIFFDWDADNNPDHMGLVEKIVDYSVITIQGNADGAVRRIEYSLGDSRIYAYGNTTKLMQQAGLDVTETPEIEDAEEEPELTVVGKAVTTAGGVNVRSKANGDIVVTQIAKSGTEVEVYGSEDVDGTLWFHIKAGSAVGYIRGDLIEMVAEDATEEIPAPETEETEEPVEEIPEETEAPAEEETAEEDTAEEEPVVEPTPVMPEEEDIDFNFGEPTPAPTAEPVVEPEVTEEPAEETETPVEEEPVVEEEPTAEPEQTEDVIEVEQEGQSKPESVTETVVEATAGEAEEEPELPMIEATAGEAIEVPDADTAPETEAAWPFSDTIEYVGGVIARTYGSEIATLDLNSELNVSYVTLEQTTLTVGEEATWVVTTEGGQEPFTIQYQLYRQDMDDEGTTYYGVSGSGQTKEDDPATEEKESHIYSFTIPQEGRYVLQFIITDQNGDTLTFQSGKYETSVDELKAKVDELIATYVTEGKSDYQIALDLHDWLCENAVYDKTLVEHDPRGVLLDGAGVCESFALAYQMLMTEAGIENLYVTGTANGETVVYPFAELGAITVLGRNKLNLYHGDRLYQLKNTKGFNALKYVFLYHRYRNVASGHPEETFLGM